jgi:hypothetical protein
MIENVTVTKIGIRELPNDHVIQETTEEVTTGIEGDTEDEVEVAKETVVGVLGGKAERLGVLPATERRSTRQMIRHVYVDQW